MTGWQRPAEGQLDALPRPGKVGAIRFRDDGVTPHHPRWPLLVLRRAVRLPRSLDPAAVFEDIFERNGWSGSWRDGVYDYLHYHSRIHEVMGVARGTAKVRFGGEHGRTIKLSAGDVAILPAGTGHQCIAASKTFLVVGAYPQTGTYDECVPTTASHKRNLARVRKVPRPSKDPFSALMARYSTTGRPHAELAASRN
ncbi:MAG: cupin domain-containing protein [Xanthobacteraceae bacterium]